MFDINVVTSVVDCWFIFAIFVCGLCVGSFLNVLIYRLPRGLGFVKSRSFCPKCRKKIGWIDNVPVLSFLMLRGRCRYCKSHISWRYPLVELATGGIFLLSYLSRLDILGYPLFCGLIVIFFIDLEHQIIPDEILLPLIGLFLIKIFFPLTTYYLLLNTLFSAVGSALFLFVIHLITKGRGMGFGDVKLAFLMGLVLGYPKVIVAFYFAFLTGALVGVTLIVLRKAKFGQKIAFGPFLAAGTFVAYLWGEKIISWAQKLLF